MATKIKRKMLNFGEFKKGKNTLETAAKHPIKENLSEMTQDAKDFIAKKIKLLVDEGRPQKQAVAMAYSYAKKEGFDVPENESVEESLITEANVEAKDLVKGELYKIHDMDDSGKLIHSAARFEGKDAKGNKFTIVNLPKEMTVWHKPEANLTYTTTKYEKKK